METGLSIGEPDETRTRALGPDMALVVTLRNGEQLHARVGADGPAASDRLQQLQLDLARESFVRIGDELVLRADEIQAVALAREREPDGRRERGPAAGGVAAIAHRSSARLTPVERVEDAMLHHVGRLPTAELVAAALGIGGVLLAALLLDTLDASGAWLVVALILAAYIVSRGISKAGSEGRRAR